MSEWKNTSEITSGQGGLGTLEEIVPCLILRLKACLYSLCQFKFLADSPANTSVYREYVGVSGNFILWLWFDRLHDYYTGDSCLVSRVSVLYLYRSHEMKPAGLLFSCVTFPMLPSSVSNLLHINYSIFKE